MQMILIFIIIIKRFKLSRTMSKPSLVFSTKLECQAIEYNRLLKRAESAFLVGKQQEAESLYLSAFDISLKLLQSPTANRVSIERMVEISNYCFDHCSVLCDCSEYHFLEEAGEALAALLLQSNKSELSSYLLRGYREVANLAFELVRFNQSIRAQEIVNSYIHFERIYKKSH
ncbi:hypothetical protein CWC20_20455 [Pseudoalteromonas aurantia]|uniref:Uncharacterized protein n=3 Tax=Pseudoalteromonas TaxID=53246 RepID=A0ABY2VS94_9GAMM|nr:hypothetical protein CWC20_20455 [Pseudoalteromonas aurantia]